MKIAYLINQYPGTAHSFIRREIVALEALGLSIVRYTLRHDTDPLADEADQRESERTAVVIDRPVSIRVLNAVGIVASHPLKFVKALVYAICYGRKSDRSVGLYVVYLMEAAVIAAWCRRDCVDHLHVHFGTNSAAVGMFVNKLIGIPWSFTAHGPEEFDRPLGIALADKIASAKFVVAISSFGRSQLLRWTKYAQWKKVKIVHCGLDATFLSGVRAAMADRPRLICIGRLCEQKGQLLLVEAARLLKRSKISFEIVFAGDGPMRKDIEEAALAAGLEDYISITGWISGQRVREEIEQARALVMPSFAEGLPVVIMEAMALERPVVSTWVAGIPELVISGENGWLVPAGDVAALAQALTGVLSVPRETLMAMGKRARERVLMRHDVMIEADKLKMLFEGKD